MAPAFMVTRCIYCVAALAFFLTVQTKSPAATEVLDWNTGHRTDITCIYGEIMVLATIPKIYFCGAEWYGVGGYCGIQHISATDRRTIFSIWDTSPELHPKVTAADAQTVFNRFKGEGEGAHTHMPWDWKVGETFRFFLQKVRGTNDGTTDTQFYIFDQTRKAWRQVATINSPDGPKHQGATFAGVVSWIENIGGQADAATPKAALYSLWTGASPDAMKRLTRTGGKSGSGRWGKLGDTYFLAEGSPDRLAAFFAGQTKKYGEPVFGVDGKELPPVSDTPLPDSLVQELKNLARAPAPTKTP